METITQNTNSNSHDAQNDVVCCHDDHVDSDLKTMKDHHIRIIVPHSLLPKPEAPPGLSSPPPPPPSPPLLEDSNSKPWNFIRIRSNRFSAAIVKKLSSFKEVPLDEVTQISMSGVKVIVNKTESEEEKEEEKEEEVIKGRISFFSRSNCRDCTAVRTFFRERKLKFVEINVDVYREREKELMERCGSKLVPQIFFNDKLLGGLVALNSLRNSGEFDKRLRDLMEKQCYSDPPAPPVYGFDDPDDESKDDDMLRIVTFLRQKLPIQDRIIKLKIVRNCFSADDVIDLLFHHLNSDRSKAIEIGRQLSRKHFIHHVFRENEFEEGNNFYRFLEHEADISSCYNFRVNTNDSEPKAAVMVGQRLAKIMFAILESYASDDRTHVDYAAIAKSEEFRRYVNVIQDLHRVNVNAMNGDERLAFFLNLYNAMVIHAIIRIGHPEGVMDRKAFFSDFEYVVGGYTYSIHSIKNGILRNNRRGSYSIVKPFSAGDKRLELTFEKVNPLIHFGLCNGTKSCPIVRFFTPKGVEAELRFATREFFKNGGMEINLEKRTVHLTRIIKWFSGDFVPEKEIPKWILNYLDATKAGLLTHLMDDGGPIHIVYQNFDWSPNS